jgi:hypothetical protein
MVEVEELLAMNLAECKVPLVKVIETVHACTTASLLKILAADLEAQRSDENQFIADQARLRCWILS